MNCGIFWVSLEFAKQNHLHPRKHQSEMSAHVPTKGISMTTVQSKTWAERLGLRLLEAESIEA
jgi:hypothetical protein